MVSKFSALTVVVVMFAGVVSGCAVTTTPEQKSQLEQAVQARDPSSLQGKMRVLYDRRMSEIQVEEAVAARDPSGLKGRQQVQYLRLLEVAKEQDRRELARQRELAEQERLAAEEQARLLREQEELEAQQRAQEIEDARQRRIAAAKAFQRKIRQPVHDDWVADMQDLTRHFRDNGFEPANRLVDVYARTMQFLLHVEPDEKQFTAFYNGFSDTEKLDHRRMFHNETGSELIAQFWDNRSSKPVKQ